MRIERAEHAPDGPGHKSVGFHLVDVAVFDGAQSRTEAPVVFGNLVIGGKSAPSEKAAKQCRHGNREQDDSQRTITPHDRILSDNLLMSNDFGARQPPGSP